MEQYTSANVEMAVLQFYYQGASQETHQWLTSAQMSTSAWNFAWELLMPGKKPEVQFFGASTIAIKVSKFWHEVPSEQVEKNILFSFVVCGVVFHFLSLLQYDALRKRIIDTLTTYKGLRIVLTRLCVALASVVIKSIPGHWEKPIQDILTIFSGNSTLLFEILTVIPEEFSTQVRAMIISTTVFR